MSKKLKVDEDKCIGCGTCVAVAPKSFKLNDDGKSIPIDPPGDEESAVQEAIESCPVDAISVKKN
jgi:ferredoxin